MQAIKNIRHTFVRSFNEMHEVNSYEGCRIRVPAFHHQNWLADFE
jgi:hypothetical protein